MPSLRRARKRFVRPRATFEPAYLATYQSGRLAEKVEEGLAALSVCRVCPRDCDVDRLADERAVCKTGRYAQVSSAFAHFGEEDCLRGQRGSGTIFFSQCNLRCVFCQNFDISWRGGGEELTGEQLGALMLGLQEAGCHNINLVTPEHVVPQVLEGLLHAVERGLRLPLVYNTSAFDSAHSIELMDGVVDIYMPDLKFQDQTQAQRFALTRSYPEHARRAIRAMHAQVGELVLDEDGLALRGVLVRHLVMPDNIADTGRAMRFLAEEVSPDTYVNIMGQYRPAGLVVSRPERYPGLARTVRRDEMARAFAVAETAGLHRFDGRYAT